ncbi:MAG: DUF1573 domain-containing protein [Fluviicola sp.]|nr:DUF1573 domain-containing protein [Fluviicola sp.]
MKFTVAFILLVLNSAFGFGQTAEFFCDHPVHKFPRTQEGVQLKYTFEISNTGKAPLIISDYDVACTCTKVTLPGVIKPGDVAEITVEFDTNGKYYQQDRTIILHTNSKKKTEYLRFKVFVVPTED